MLMQSNASVGLPAPDLSGGCICCSRKGELQESLAAMRASTSTRPDYLVSPLSVRSFQIAILLKSISVGFSNLKHDFLFPFNYPQIVETSGVADPEELAIMLSGLAPQSFKLNHT